MSSTKNGANVTCQDRSAGVRKGGNRVQVGCRGGIGKEEDL